MVHTTCAVYGCMSSSRLSKELKFHQFPHTEERYKHWIGACGRDDLVGKTFNNLKNLYVCSLHFEKQMYGKKSLKKIASPTLRIPTKKAVLMKSTHTQTDPENKETVFAGLPKKHFLQDSSEQHEIDPSTLLEIDIGASDSEDHSQNEAENSALAAQKRKLDKKSGHKNKLIKLRSQKHEVEVITKEQFLKACDVYLSPTQSAIVKADLHLRAERQNIGTMKVNNYFE